MPALQTSPTPPRAVIAHQAYAVSFLDHQDAAQTITLDFLPDDPSDVSMIGNAAAIADDAGKALAARYIDLSAMGGDSAYLDALDNLRARFALLSICKVGGEARYTVDGIYGDQTGPWTEDILAVDEEDAEFQGRWQMTLNACGLDGEKGLDADRRDDFLASLEDHTIHHVTANPIDRDDLASEIASLIREYRAGTDIAERIRVLDGMLAQIGHRTVES
jgi:hypothetical protein